MHEDMLSSGFVRRAFKIVSVVVAVVAAWIYFFTGTPPFGSQLPLKNIPVTSIELFWGGTNRTVSASNQCVQVIHTVQRARQSAVVATPLFGSLTLHYADGTTNQFFLSPSGRFSGLEIANSSGGYAISMGEMLGTFESVGLLPKGN
jgi:hypothetical protein